MFNLAPEVLSLIFAHLVPSNHTFLLNAREPETTRGKLQSAAATSPSIQGSLLVQEGEATPQYPATVFSNCNVDIFGLLLLNSTIHTAVVECLYSNNIFYPPDLTTLFCLRQMLSPRAVASIRTIRMDACGPATCFFRGYNHFYRWSKLADTDISNIPGLFPGMRELRLGGIGPGVVQRRAFTYRGSRCVRDTEINDIWTLSNILLISSIIGVPIPHELPLDEREIAETGNGVTASDHTLSAGRVFCMRYDARESLSLAPGSHRLYGTRIVRRGEAVRLGEMDQELVDVRDALMKALKVRDEFRALGVSEVHVHDMVQ